MALNLTMTGLRLLNHSKVFFASFYHPVEGLWHPTLPIALSSILIGIIIYGIPYCGPWLVEACYVMYWVYLVGAGVSGMVVQSTM